MKKEFDFQFEKGKFILVDTNTSKKSGFFIDSKTLEFDTRKFYEVIFSDINEHIDMSVNYCCSNLESETEKISKYVYKLINELASEICKQLNSDCFQNK